MRAIVFLSGMVLSPLALNAEETTPVPSPAETAEVRGEALVIKEGPPDKFMKGSFVIRSQSLGAGHGPPAPHVVDPASIAVKKGGEGMVAGKDFGVDPVFASLGVLPGGRLQPGDHVEVDYRYSYPRIDSLIQRSDGVEEIVKGEALVAAPKAPGIPEGATRLANYYVFPFSREGDAERFEIPGNGMLPPTETVAGCVPRTLARLEAGEKVKIVCWGDSVTEGADASSGEKSFPYQLARLLRERYPSASIDVQVIAVGGSGTVHWLFPEVAKHPTRPEMCDWGRVVEARPDLVVMEFVNDSYLRGEAFQKHYQEALRRVRELNAELLLVAPHFVYPKDMGFSTLKESDKRPYVRQLKDFAKANGVAFADASGAWGNLWRKGVPYLSYLKNGINHPDDEGHLLMAEEISRCFDSGTNR